MANRPPPNDRQARALSLESAPPRQVPRDVERDLANLTRRGDWKRAAQVLEAAIVGEPNLESQVELHMRVGRLYRWHLLDGLNAMKHFQRAFVLKPEVIEVLQESRGVYWDLGKLDMVRKLLELELKAGKPSARRSDLSQELGTVYWKLGDPQQARAAFEKMGAAGLELSQDLLVDEAEAAQRLRSSLTEIGELKEPQAKAFACLRAARLATRVAPEQEIGLLSSAFRAAPGFSPAAVLYELELVKQKGGAALSEEQKSILDSVSNGADRVRLASHFAFRWTHLHGQPRVAEHFKSLATRFIDSR